MSTVYVLGAGASRAEDSAIPMVSDFLEKAFELGKFGSQEASKFINNIASVFGWSAEDLERGIVDIEQLFSLIDSDVDWEELASSQGDFSDRWFSSSRKGATLEGLIGGVLFQVVPPVFRKNESHHKRLAQVIAEGDAVISFNYDLIADWALGTQSKLTIKGYVLNFGGQLGENSSSIESVPCEPPSKVTLLKLHGSLNWLRDADGEREDLIYLKDAFERSLCGDQWGPIIEYREENSRKQILFKPFLVPPTADKSKIWAKYGRTLRPLWEKAGEVLKNCDRLVIAGYSLRDTDYQSRWLFRRFLSPENKKRKIDIVNKNADDRCRLRQFLHGLGKIEEHISFERFVAKLAG